MTEPTITCPSCGTDIHLTEQLAAPLIEADRRRFQEQLARKDAEMAAHEEALRSREAALRVERDKLDEELERRVGAERERIAEAEARRARERVQTDLDESAKRLKDIEDVLRERTHKLAEAQQAQADLIRKERELEDARREMGLTIEKQVQEGIGAAREQARKEAEDSLKLKVAEKEQTIASMQRQIEELKRKAEQGSQQLQGEVQELELEELLRARFPLDEITPVPKGQFGGDVVQGVRGPGGDLCGTILWESKRTRNWSSAWLAKLREDQRAAKADLAVIVSRVLPDGVENFDMVDHVWVTQPRLAVPVAMILRQTLIDVARVRQASEGLQTKTELVYQYLTGPRFRQRIQGIVEAFDTLRTDLEAERKAITKQWAKREAQIERVMQGTLGMYGDLQGIAGQSLQQIEGLELPALTNDAALAVNPVPGSPGS